MMHHLRRAGAEFPRAHVPALGERDRNDEGPDPVGATAGQHVWTFEVHDQIWRTECPALCRDWCGGRGVGIALEGTLRQPPRERSDRLVRQTSSTNEFAESRFRFPRWHRAAADRADDLAGARLRVVKREQRKG